MGVDHPEYRTSIPVVPAETRDALAADLTLDRAAAD
jgi:hypothetical protein